MPATVLLLLREDVSVVVVMSPLLSGSRLVVSGLVQLAFDESAEQLRQALTIGWWQALPPTVR